MRARIRSLLALVAGAILLVLMPGGGAHANVESFSYAHWSARYEVWLDDDDRAHAHVIETLVARFPDLDQNRGIVRGLETRYQGSSVHTTVRSVTDEQGNPVHYTTDREDGTLYVALGTHEFAHGLTTYVIEYTMRDVMIAADGVDEFYWNLLPLRSNQIIEVFDTTIAFSPELSAALTGDRACYEGYVNSTARCTLDAPRFVGDSAVFTVSSDARMPGFGMTVAIGFEPDTVAQPLARRAGGAADAIPFVSLAGAAGAAAVGGAAYARLRRRARTATGVIVAQYEVPDSLPPLVAAHLIPRNRNLIPAQLVHLAVRGVWHIQSPPKPARPTFHLADPSLVGDPIDAQARDRILEGAPSAALPPRSEAFAKKMAELVQAGKKAAVDRGLLHKQRSRGARRAFLLALGLVVLAAASAGISRLLGRESGETVLIVTLILGAIILVFAYSSSAPHDVHTPEGAIAYEHLEGVREFIRVAEADRIRMLQSATGAERYRTGSVELVRLYERLLPYAMLFGQEKSWGTVLEVAYGSAHSSAAWMSGSSSFSTGLSSFSSSALASSASSSGGGGSGGGGSSGGGGGGGSSGGR